MKIHLKSPYKSLRPFVSPPLPPLTIITGKNGAGKSQLLELLRSQDPTMSVTEKKAYSQVAGQVTLEDFVPVKIKHTTFGQSGLAAVASGNTQQIEALKKDLIAQLPVFQKAPNFYLHLHRVLQKIAENNSISHERLTIDNINLHDFSGNDFEIKDVFSVNLSQTIVTYFERFEKNLSAKMSAEHFKTGKSFLDQEEFSAQNPNPFVLINSVLNTSKLDYLLQEESVKDYYTSKIYSPIFVHTKTNVRVQASELSTGEKVLLSLAFSVLNNSYYPGQRLPNLLLLDEIDAPLHPSMIQKLIAVLQKELIQKYKVRVILTTHNPSTIALAPEESVFLLKKPEDSGERLIKVDRRFAIKELLDGVRSIDVIPKTVKTVFTESRQDKIFFETVYSLHREMFEPDVGIEFISSGVHDGDKDLVKSLVSKLRSAGNDSIFGIIDWDKQNTTRDGILVHSEGQRYSIENVILCPIFLGILMLMENVIRVTEIFPETKDPYHKIFGAAPTVQQLEALIAHVSKKIFPGIGDQLVPVKLANQLVVKFPVEYLEHNGHKLEEQIRTSIPSFQKFHNQNELMRTVLERVIINYKDLLPLNIIETIISCQNSN